MKLIAGLGNPGNQYENTRHNVGFELVSKIKSKLPHLESLASFSYDKKFDAQVVKSNQLILALPQTYMNLSGRSVSAIANYYKINTHDICVIHDDLDILMGNFKFELGRGPKIHNGVNSVETSLDTKDFWRVRIGVDNRTLDEKSKIKGSDYVLKKITSKESQILDKTFVEIIVKLKTEFLNLES